MTADGKRGLAGFGVRNTPGAAVRTNWNTNDIWIRRVFQIDRNVPKQIALRIHHDEDVQVFLNGSQVLQQGGFTTGYETSTIPATALQTGTNVFAVHCRQTSGGQYIDVGIDELVPGKQK